MLNKESVEAGIYVAWENALRAAVTNRLVPADARYFPAFFSRKSVEGVTESRLVLEPGAGPAQ